MRSAKLGMALSLLLTAALPPACKGPPGREAPAEIPGWYRSSSASDDYVVGIDHAVAHGGSSAAYLEAKSAKPEGYGTLMQTIQPGRFKGQRVRFSATVRAAGVTGWAGLWMRVDGKEGTILDLDNMQDRPVRGTTEWARHEVVLDVEPVATDIAFGVLLVGAGTVWLDDVSLEAVDSSVPVTKASANGWWAGGSAPADYAMGEDPAPSKSGATRTAFLRSRETSAPADRFGSWARRVEATPWRGQRVRLSGWIEATGVSGWAGLWMRVDGAENEVLGFDNMGDRPIKGSRPWTSYEVVLDVPSDAGAIAYGTLLAGAGALRMADVAVEVVDESVPVSKAAYPREPKAGEWSAMGSAPANYTMGEDPAPSKSGTTRTAFLRSRETSAPADRFGSWARRVEATPWRGQRVRLSGRVEAIGVSGWAGLWMRVDGAPMEVLGFDNMMDRPIKGSRPWTSYEVVLDVPSDAGAIAYGTLLAGAGALRMADVTIEVVDESVPVTKAAYPREPKAGSRRPDPPTPGYHLAGSAPEAFEASGDPGAARGAGAVLRSRVADPDGFGTLMDSVSAAPFRGKKARLTGQVKADDVRGWAGLWARVDGADGKPLAFDNMQGRAIRGSLDWARYAVVLDVPDTAGRIAFGALLSGAGRIEVGELSLAPASAPASTDLVRRPRAFPELPRNLGFEEL